MNVFQPIKAGNVAHLTASVRQLRWHTRYWGIALAIGLFLFGFEAIQIVWFAPFRAPNVGLVVQLALTLLFYSAWVFAPRLAWAVFDQTTGTVASLSIQLVGRLVLAGLVLSIAHLGFLAILKLFMWAGAGWGFAMIPIAILETWIGYSGLWLVIYALSCFVIYIVRSRLAKTDHSNQRFEVRKNGKILSVSAHEILWVEASGNYVQLHTGRGIFMLRKSLAKLSTDLQGGAFVRSHRQALINLDHVQSINSSAGLKTFEVHLSDGNIAPLSRRKLTAFKSKMLTSQ